jgi:hypothetical protein
MSRKRDIKKSVINKDLACEAEGLEELSQRQRIRQYRLGRAGTCVTGISSQAAKAVQISRSKRA